MDEIKKEQILLLIIGNHTNTSGRCSMAHDITGIIDFEKDTDTWAVLEIPKREGAHRMLQQALEIEI